MTYDEMVALVGRFSKGSSVVDMHGWRATKAVLELHQPKVESDLNDYLLCEECTEISWRSEKWPCHTIKAIQESLV